MTKIKINVFNLTPLNKLFSCCKVGVYHTSLVIDERFEYYYGFSDWGYTGIDTPEKVNCLPSVMSGSFHSSYELGESSLSLHDCREIARSFKKSKLWLSDHYNFLYHNCNTFTLELAKILMGTDYVNNYPYWVTRGENIAKILYSISLSHFFVFLKKIPGFSYPYGPDEPINKDNELTEIENASAKD